MLLTDTQLKRTLADIRHPGWTWVPDFLYTPEQIRVAAYALTSGDPIEGRLGHHRGHPEFTDLAGVTKQMIHDAAVLGDQDFFEINIGATYPHGKRAVPSIRARITDKKTRKQRDIDISPEAARPLLALVNGDLLRFAEAKRALPNEIISYRSLGDLPDYVASDAATIQDQFAGLVARRLVAFGPWVVSVDLEDHFGRLPREAQQAALRKLGLSKASRKRIIELARIRTLPRGGQRIITKRDRGVEQGNVLSATLSNLVMGMVIRKLANRGIASAMYGDDIVLFAATRELARQAFDTFTLICERDLAFDNIRGTTHPTKPTRIIDTREIKLELIKTYTVEINSDGGRPHALVGLVANKLDDLRRLISETGPTGAMSPRQIRRLAGAQALTKRWMAREGLISSNTIPQPSSTAATVEEGTNHTIPSLAPPLRGGALERMTSDPAVNGDEGGSTAPLKAGLAGGGHMRAGDTAHVNACPGGDSSGLMREWDRAAFDEGVDAAARESDPGETGVAVPVAGGSTPHAVATEIYPTSSRVDRPRSGRANPVLPGVTAPSTGGEGLSSPPGPVLLMLDPTPYLEEALRGERPKLGDLAKGWAVDLRQAGKGMASANPEAVVAAVNALLALVGHRNVSLAVIHPGDRWLARTDLLGGPDDPLWRRGEERPIPGGVLLSLYRRVASESHRVPALGGFVLVQAWHRSSHQRRWTVSVTFRPDDQDQVVEVSSPDESIGRVEAIATVVAELDGPVAFPDYPSAVQVVGPKPPRQAGLHRAWSLLSTRRWRRCSGWWVSQPGSGESFE